LTHVSDTNHIRNSKTDQLEVFKRAYEREKIRRKYVEKMLEDKSRDLYLSQQELINKNNELTTANTVITDLSNDYDRVTQDLIYAAKIQNSLLPKSIENNSIAAVGTLTPAQFIAGDGFDFYYLSDAIFAFYMIDVVGHGTAAAMLSFAIQMQLNPKDDGICRKFLIDTECLSDAVQGTLEELNRIFYQEHSSTQYFTMIYGLIDLSNGNVTFGQAGHPPPIHYCSTSGTIGTQGKNGTPVALLEDPSFGVYSFKMGTGDRLVVYSDGVSECRNESDEEFGVEFLFDPIVKSHSTSIHALNSILTDTVSKWNGSDSYEDDMSLLLLEYK